MKTTTAFKNHQTNLFQVQLAIITTASIVALIATALSPLLTTCLEFFLAIQLILSQKNWKNWATITTPQTEFQLDFSIKIVLAGLALLTAIFIVQLHVISQMVLLTTGGLLMGACLAYPCLQGSQLQLNQALQQSILALDVESVEILLARGADPYAPDENGNTAFHLAIQNDPRSIDVLNKLKSAPKAPLPNQVWERCQSLFSEEISQQWQQIWLDCKSWMSERTQPNFAKIIQGYKVLWALYYPQLTHIANGGIEFLRGEMFMPRNRQYQNNANQTAEALIELNKLEAKLAQAARENLNPDAKPMPSAPRSSGEKGDTKAPGEPPQTPPPSSDSTQGGVEPNPDDKAKKKNTI